MIFFERLFEHEKLMKSDNLSVTDLSCELSIVPDNNSDVMLTCAYP